MCTSLLTRFDLPVLRSLIFSPQLKARNMSAKNMGSDLHSVNSEVTTKSEMKLGSPAFVGTSAKTTSIHKLPKRKTTVQHVGRLKRTLWEQISFWVLMFVFSKKLRTSKNSIFGLKTIAFHKKEWKCKKNYHARLWPQFPVWFAKKV